MRIVWMRVICDYTKVVELVRCATHGTRKTENCREKISLEMVIFVGTRNEKYSKHEMNAD